MDKAYSVFSIKAVNEDERVITGIASTPSVDRVGEVMVSDGAKFNLPIPFLLHHDTRSPIGSVTSARVTSKGIEVTAKIAQTKEEGALKTKLDEAWQMIKSGLLRGLSVGFRSLEQSFDKEIGAYRHLKWEWLELSAVTIPANLEASIQSIKSYDSGESASGHEISITQTPPASGKDVTDVVPMEGSMSLNEHIKALEKRRAEHIARMDVLLQKSMDEGRSTNDDENAEFDTLQANVTQLDEDITRSKSLEKMRAGTAKPLAKAATTTAGTKSRDSDPKARDPISLHNPYGGIQVRDPHSETPGIRFARVIKCLGVSKGNLMHALQLAEQKHGDDQGIVDYFKAAVAAGTTLDSTWAGALVGDETRIFADFAEFLRPMTILGKFGTNGIPALRRVPFRVRLLNQTSGGAGYWVGEGKAKPLTKFDFSSTTLTPLKVANIAVTTMELLRDSSPSAESLVRDALAAALRERMDIDFIDPTNGGVANTTPASITNDIAPVESSGTDAAAVREDFRQMMNQFIIADNLPSSAVIIMSAQNALSISLMQNALGQPEFPQMTMNGGFIAGVPVIASEYVNEEGTGGSIIVMVNASDIYFADEGGVQVDMSMEASLEMADDPTNNSDTPTETTLVSLWQTNSVGFRAERTLNWARRRTSAVAMIGDAQYLA